MTHLPCHGTDVTGLDVRDSCQCADHVTSITSTMVTWHFHQTSAVLGPLQGGGRGVEGAELLGLRGRAVRDTVEDSKVDRCGFRKPIWRACHGVWPFPQPLRATSGPADDAKRSVPHSQCPSSEMGRQIDRNSDHEQRYLSQAEHVCLAGSTEGASAADGLHCQCPCGL